MSLSFGEKRKQEKVNNSLNIPKIIPENELAQKITHFTILCGKVQYYNKIDLGLVCSQTFILQPVTHSLTELCCGRLHMSVTLSPVITVMRYNAMIYY